MKAVFVFHWWWILPLLALTACATRPAATGAEYEAGWRKHKASLETLDDWQIKGRIAVRSEDDGGSASFDWQQQGDQYRIRLRGPFGQGAVVMNGDADGVWLHRADHSPVFALNPERLLEQQTGWRVPVSGLRYWLRGLPVPDEQHRYQLDNKGYLLDIKQRDWQIDFSNYNAYNALNNRVLPTRLKLHHQPLRVKIIIDAWQPVP